MPTSNFLINARLREQAGCLPLRFAVTIATLLVFAWLIRGALLNGLPFARVPLWIDWFDQSRYNSSAVAFAHAKLNAAEHWYPLLYPLLAAPFVLLTPSDPFFILDLVLYLTAFRAFQRIAERLDLSAGVSALCFVLTTLVDPSVARSWVDPWTTTLSTAIFYWLIELTLQCRDRCLNQQPLAHGAVIGVLSAAAPLVRPVDAITSMTCLVVIGIMCLRYQRSDWAFIRAISVAGALCVLTYACLHLAIYGPHPTPYMAAAADTGFVWSDITWKAYVLLIHADPWFPDTISIFERMPWLLLGLAGMLVESVRGPPGSRFTVALIAGLILPNTAVMLVYADLQPPGLWIFGNIHYFKWTLPLIGICIPLAWKSIELPYYRTLLLGIFLVVCLIMFIRVEPVRVGPNKPARMVAFQGNTTRDWSEGYFAKSQITDAGGVLTNIGGFHQIPDKTGQHAIAVRRLFEGKEVWSDPGEAVGAPIKPYARYAGQLTILGY